MDLSKMTYVEILEHNNRQKSEIIDALEDYRKELLKTIDFYQQTIEISKTERAAYRNIIATQKDLIKALEEKIKNGNL